MSAITSFYSELRDVADELLAGEMGQVLYFRRYEKIEATETWKAPELRLDGTWQINGVAAGFNPLKIDNNFIESSDLLIHVSFKSLNDLGYEPKLDDYLVVDDQEHRLLKIGEIPPDGVNTVLYEFHARRL